MRSLRSEKIVVEPCGLEDRIKGMASAMSRFPNGHKILQCLAKGQPIPSTTVKGARDLARKIFDMHHRWRLTIPDQITVNVKQKGGKPKTIHFWMNGSEMLNDIHPQQTRRMEH